MTHLAIGLTVIWLLGIVVFAGRFLNFTRLLYNNLDPTKDFSKTGPFSAGWFFKQTDAQAIDPANLTELGRQYRKQAIRDERLAIAWSIGGLVVLTGMLAPSDDKFAIGIFATVLAGFYLWARRVRLGRATRIEKVLARGLSVLMIWLP